MVKNEEDVAMDILEHVVHAGLFNNRRSEIALRMTIICELLIHRLLAS
jgi:general transcription factor 3C polypeptide 3 (transcription factor C subunit 4)